MGTPLIIAEAGVECLHDPFTPKSSLIYESVLMMGWS
jgi:hypothetical protein